MSRTTASQKGRRRAWKAALIVACVLVLFLCCEFAIRNWRSSTSHQSQVVSAGHKTNPSHSSAPAQAQQNGISLSTAFAQHQQYWGADGWMWRAALPYSRLVVFYGNPLSAPMGPIGQYSDDDLIAHLQAQAQAYAQIDPSHPVVPALDYVTPIVQPVPMTDGTWVYRMPDDSIQHYITLANSNHALFFFDMQIGHSTVQREVERLWPFLQMPGVDLSLDPEFALWPGEIPDVEFGHMQASQVNWVIDQLSQLVQKEHLPPKILIVHRFLQEMLPDWQNIKPQPGVQVVITVDGFGSPSEKIDDYIAYDQQELLPGEYPGMKLFYRLDKPLMSPPAVLALNPPPLMVMYQ